MQFTRLVLIPCIATMLGAPLHGQPTAGYLSEPSAAGHTVSLDSETFVAEAVIRSHVFLPVTVQGHAVTLMLDVGSDQGWLSQSVLQQLGIAATASDSLPFGTAVVRNINIREAAFLADSGLAPTLGLVGADVLSKYDLLLDGPARRMRMYAPPSGVSRGSSSAAHAPIWLPPGITLDDCVPLEVDPQYPDRIFFPLQVNGRAVHSMFDSGSETTNLNLAAAKVMGITKHTPSVQLLPAGMAGQFRDYNGQKVWQVLSGLTMTIAARPLAAVPIYIYQHLPREAGPDDPELSVGLEAIHDRVMFVSYSTGRVCVGKPLAARTSTASTTGVAGKSAAIPQVLLTEDALTRMATFWTAWTHEPVAIRDTGRLQHQKSLAVNLDLGKLLSQTFTFSSVVDMRAMATYYPSVAASLVQANLTADQWEHYRQALFTAVLTEKLIKLQDNAAVKPTPKSVVAQNMAFLQAHQEAFSALQATGMWFPGSGESHDFGGDLEP